MTFTPEQERAIRARGNTLVLAGAGSGKTRTLVERCAQLLLDRETPVSARDILVVTFNESAATEVRERLRRRLEEIAAATGDSRATDQLALLDSAHISTLHGFCYTLLREHFHELGLDPAVSILDDSQARVLFLKALEELLAEHYAGLHPFSGELKEFIRAHLRGWEKPLIEFVRKTHDFTQTRPNPRGWFERQLETFRQPDCGLWEQWHEEAVREWCAWWVPWLRQLPEANTNAAVCAELLDQACKTGDPEVIARIIERDQCWPKGKKIAHRAAFKKLFEEAEFLGSLQSRPGETPRPLQQDWDWARPPLQLLMRLAMQFGERFAAAKQERCVLDFHDLEQGALRLLWTGDQPSRIAELWQRRFHAIFVDEYQDINAAQDRIISALSAGNRFLVGDNKQSIYRFRQADPAIFQRYLALPDGWRKAYLSENFRSHEGILEFINPLFSWVMRAPVGGIDYDARAMLKFADTPERAHLRSAPGQKQVELHVIFSDAEVEADLPEGIDGWTDLANAEKEARLVAARLREMRTAGFRIADASTGEARAVEWRDMVVLLRSASAKLEIYCKAFEAAGVPLHTRQNAFYATQEVLDLCNLLHLLDNPLQDIPLVAVLRSPLCGMTANELAWIRIISQAKPFWRALTEFNESKQELPGRDKVEHFLARFHGWRRARSSASLSRRLENILADTRYDEWLLSQPRGRQRYANVRQLQRIARQFDESRGESLYLFLRHIEELRDAVGDIEPAVAPPENAVRLMTVHQSKGLEFPVVAAPDLGKPFNRSDQMDSMLIDEKFGLCAMIKPPETGQRYPSLPLWLARRRQRVETLGEELRLMYVAFTRAQNHLLLFGTAREKRTESAWSMTTAEPLPHHILKASSWLDWIGGWISVAAPNWWAADQGVLPACNYQIHRALVVSGQPPAEPIGDVAEEVDLPALERRISFAYPHAASILETAKTSVSTLRRRNEELDEEARPIIPRRSGKRDGRTRGLALHAFLEHVDLNGKLDAEGLAAQAKEMPALQPAERALLDIDSLAHFWQLDFGREILASKTQVHRELEFTCKLTRGSLGEYESLFPIPEGEFVTLQGIADLAVLRPDEIWLLDFKTDDVNGAALDEAVERYRLQLTLYALALVAIYKKPVTRKALYFVQPRRLEWL
jgi:ATP-dependent helicase/nuclease subunit A